VFRLLTEVTKLDIDQMLDASHDNPGPKAVFAVSRVVQNTVLSVELRGLIQVDMDFSHQQSSGKRGPMY